MLRRNWTRERQNKSERALFRQTLKSFQDTKQSFIYYLNLFNLGNKCIL